MMKPPQKPISDRFWRASGLARNRKSEPLAEGMEGLCFPLPPNPVPHTLHYAFFSLAVPEVWPL